MIHRTISRFFAILFALTVVSNASAQISRSVGLLKGEVTLADGTALENIPVVVFRETERVTSTKSSPEGKVTAILQPNATYRIAVSASGYMYHEDTITVPALTAYREFPLHIVLTPLRDGQTFELAVPVFQPRSRDISDAAFPELDRVVDELKHNQKLSVSVVVYPDAPMKNVPMKTKKDAAARIANNTQEALAAARETSMRSYLLGKNLPDSRFTVESVTTTIPEGRFPLPANLIVHPKPVRSRGRKKKLAEPEEPSLFPQYVEIMAHVAP
ncbi:MAG TPA: carboxypeptidase-like regulatory domain-containing protein [Candidatus Kapabacteria bacterium]|nr:carboxypeptidase-like regulatory domain-containing protein [Candidatus Kapabacteria bacterium]